MLVSNSGFRQRTKGDYGRGVQERERRVYNQKQKQKKKTRARDTHACRGVLSPRENDEKKWSLGSTNTWMRKANVYPPHLDTFVVC